MNYEYKIGDKIYQASVEKDEEDGYRVRISDKVLTVKAMMPIENLLSMDIDGRRIKAYIAGDDESKLVSLDGHVFTLERPYQQDAATASEASSGGVVVARDYQVIKAPMPGTVVKIHVTCGDIVKPRQCCIIIEAMKMEHPLLSELDGEVVKVHVKERDLVSTSCPLVEIKKRLEA